MTQPDLQEAWEKGGYKQYKELLKLIDKKHKYPVFCIIDTMIEQTVTFIPRVMLQ